MTSHFFVLLLLHLLVSVELAAQRNRQNFTINFSATGLLPGPLSRNEIPFRGRQSEVSVSYNWIPRQAKFGLESTVGLTLVNYRYTISPELFIRHRQSMVAVACVGFIKITDRLRLHAGLKSFIPLLHGISRNRPPFSLRTYFENINTGAWHVAPVQVGAIIGLEYFVGEKHNTGIGVFITQMGNAPVRDNSPLVYQYRALDGGNNLKPLHVSFRVAVGLGKKKAKAD